jgi:membrane protease YdiL (CAAX protease family)
MGEWSLVFPLTALFGPAIGACVVLWVNEGRDGIWRLLARFRVRRADLPWLAVAGLLPLALTVPTWLLGSLAGSSDYRLTPLSAVSFVIAALIVGEEVGWRGFALPYLLRRQPALAASLVLGVIWAFWHLPNFLLPGFPHNGLPFPAFVLMVVAYAVLFTWLYGRTEGSLTVAVVFHAAINLFSLADVDPGRQYWLRAAVYSACALAVVLLSRKRGLAGGESSGEAGL